jgi:hypothetical protein
VPALVVFVILSVTNYYKPAERTNPSSQAIRAEQLRQRQASRLRESAAAETSNEFSPEPFDGPPPPPGALLPNQMASSQQGFARAWRKRKDGIS